MFTPRLMSVCGINTDPFPHARNRPAHESFPLRPRRIRRRWVPFPPYLNNIASLPGDAICFLQFCAVLKFLKKLKHLLSVAVNKKMFIHTHIIKHMCTPPATLRALLSILFLIEWVEVPVGHRKTSVPMTGCASVRCLGPLPYGRAGSGCRRYEVFPARDGSPAYQANGNANRTAEASLAGVSLSEVLRKPSSRSKEALREPLFFVKTKNPTPRSQCRGTKSLG